MRRILIFIAGTKGGVGKSFTTIMLAGAAKDLALPLRIFDTDNENQTVFELLKGEADFLDEIADQYPLDDVINSLYAENPAIVTIVDMKAGTSRSTQEWFASVPWDDLRRLDLDVYVVGCVTSDPDSVRTFVPWLEYFRRIDFPVEYLIIKNEKDGDHFFTCTSLLEPAMQKLKLHYQIFNFPAIEQDYINALNNNNLTLREHMMGGHRVLSTIMQKSRLRNHYFAITDQLILFFATKMGDAEFCDNRDQILKNINKRIALKEKKVTSPRVVLARDPTADTLVAAGETGISSCGRPAISLLDPARPSGRRQVLKEGK